jgi:hypothetical protein
MRSYLLALCLFFVCTTAVLQLPVLPQYCSGPVLPVGAECDRLNFTSCCEKETMCLRHATNCGGAEVKEVYRCAARPVLGFECENRMCRSCKCVLTSCCTSNVDIFINLILNAIPIAQNYPVTIDPLYAALRNLNEAVLPGGPALWGSLFPSISRELGEEVTAIGNLDDDGDVGLLAAHIASLQRLSEAVYRICGYAVTGTETCPLISQ